MTIEIKIKLKILEILNRKNCLSLLLKKNYQNLYKTIFFLNLLIKINKKANWISNYFPIK